MKWQLTGTDFVENHHIWGMINDYMMDNHGKKPEYIIIHPETEYKIQAQISNREELSYQVIQYDYRSETPKRTMYGVSLIRSYDVEEGFILIV